MAISWLAPRSPSSRSSAPPPHRGHLVARASTIDRRPARGPPTSLVRPRSRPSRFRTVELRSYVAAGLFRPRTSPAKTLLPCSSLPAPLDGRSAPTIARADCRPFNGVPAWRAGAFRRAGTDASTRHAAIGSDLFKGRIGLAEWLAGTLLQERRPENRLEPRLDELRAARAAIARKDSVERTPRISYSASARRIRAVAWARSWPHTMTFESSES